MRFPLLEPIENGGAAGAGLSVTQSTSRTYRLGESVTRLGGELVGDAAAEIHRIATLESAGPGDLSFLTHSRYKRSLQHTRASAVILARNERNATSLPRILCDDPYVYYARVAQLLHVEDRPAPGVHSTAVVEPDSEIAASAAVGPGCYVGPRARLGEGVIIGAGCVLGADAQIGPGSRLHASVTVYPGCTIGRRAIIHAGVVIGADGFGMANEGERWIKIPQTGRVVIGDDVEIGANTTIDRGALDDTVIEDGVKLDNQIQIGHNVRVGAHTVMAGCVAVAGSTRIGRHCTIAGAARIIGHVDIADHVTITAAAVVLKPILKAGVYSGAFPSAPNREWAKTVAYVRGLDDLAARIRELEKKFSKSEKKKR